MKQESETVSLRIKVLKGSAYLTVGHGAMVVLGVFGALLLTRIIGPAGYGLYGSAYSIFGYLLAIGKLGVSIYLVREHKDASPKLFHLAFWWLLGYGTLLTIFSSIIIIITGYYWVRTEGFIPVMLSLSALLPLAIVSTVPLALLERELDYRKTTAVEVGSQAVFYITAVPLASNGFGVWAMVAGFWLSQIVSTVGFFAAARYCPRRYWNGAELRPMLRYGFSVALSGWIYQAQSLAPPLLLLPMAGAEAVGYVVLAQRFIVILAFVKDALSRLALPAFAQIQHDSERLLRAIRDATQLQTLGLGTLFVFFTIISPFVLPYFLGNHWNINLLMAVFAVAGITTLIGALFSTQSAALMVKKQTRLLLGISITYIFSLFSMTYLLLVLMPQEYRLLALNVADLVAALPTICLNHMGVRRSIGCLTYGATPLWTIGFAAALLAPWLSWWLYGVTVVLLAYPASLKQLKKLYHSLVAQRFGKRVSPE